MIVNVNHSEKEIADHSVLTSLLIELQITTDGIAIAINNAVIPKSQWNETQLSAQDQITIITATQGG